MKISEISVKRPVFATVVSLLLVILGLLAYSRLSVRELPEVESPVVSIETTYRGAAADVVETKITQIIEDRVSGIEGVTKITSQSVDGRSSINLEFVPERDVDGAANDGTATKEWRTLEEIQAWASSIQPMRVACALPAASRWRVAFAVQSRRGLPATASCGFRARRRGARARASPWCAGCLATMPHWPT